MAQYDITKLNSPLTFDTNEPTYSFSFKLDDTRVVNFWYDNSSTHSSARVFQTNLSTGEITALGTQLDVSGISRYGSILKIDANHFLALYTGAGEDGFARVFEVNTSTWNVSVVGSGLEFDTVYAGDITALQMSSNKFIVTWCDDGGNKRVKVFEVNTSTWNVSVVGSGTTSSDNRNGYPMLMFKIDSTHFVSFGTTGGLKAYARAWEVNLSTGAITSVGTDYMFHNDAANRKTIIPIDSNNFLVFYSGFSNMEIKIISVNTTNWTFSTLSTNTSTSITNTNYYYATLNKIDDNHFVLVRGTNSSNEIDVWEVNLSTWETTRIKNLQLYNSRSRSNSTSQLSSYLYCNFWCAYSLTDGLAQIFSIEPPTADESNFLLLF